jgi:hypothetical protein
MAVMDESSTLPQHESMTDGTAMRRTENRGSNHWIRDKKKKQSPVQTMPILVNIDANDSNGFAGCLSSRDSTVLMDEGGFSYAGAILESI